MDTYWVPAVNNLRTLVVVHETSPLPARSAGGPSAELTDIRQIDADSRAKVDQDVDAMLMRPATLSKSLHSTASRTGVWRLHRSSATLHARLKRRGPRRRSLARKPERRLKEGP